MHCDADELFHFNPGQRILEKCSLATKLCPRHLELARLSERLDGEKPLDLAQLSRAACDRILLTKHI